MSGDREGAALDRAAELAAAGLMDVLPNPPVGCVLIGNDGRVLAEGHHARDGGPHAEEVALQAMGGDGARGATACVSLEPCGRDFPGKRRRPCAEALLAAGVARVVYGAADPSPAGGGAGPDLLRKAGVTVEYRPHEGCAALLRPWLEAREDAVPWTVAKWAMSLDGRTGDATGASRWISGEASRKRAHRLRASCDAIVVGARTAALDDPDLRPRDVPDAGPPPLRVVVDGALRISSASRLAATAREGPVLVATRACPAGERRNSLASMGVELVTLPDAERGVDLRALFELLRSRGVRRVLLEGGGELAAAAFHAGLVRQVAVFMAPLLLGGRSAPRPVAGERPLSLMAEPLRLEFRRVEALGDDVLTEGLVPRRS